MAILVNPNLISDFLLVNSREAGEVLTNLKLQKLLYYSQAWFLALVGRPLFDEDFQAWVHGPVLPSQYYRFNDFKWQPITTDVSEPTFADTTIADHLCEVLEVFGPESAFRLEQMTHGEQPWQLARGELPPHEPSRAIIRKEWMRDYYAGLASGENQEASTDAA